ncbi:MAG: biopolymer transporter ExbD [Bdellovibrionia bacterium]
MASGFGFSEDEDVFSAINVTPLVDVVLVLLIIFMITAPAIYQSAIKVQLPKAKSGEASEKPPMSFVISKEGTLTWNQEAVTWETLEQRLATEKERSLNKNDPQASQTMPVMISADEATPHGTVIRLMDLLKVAGITKFAISVQPGATSQPAK